MKTGIIGLGAMGVGMSMNLHKSGQLSAVWNRTADRARTLARETGVAQAATPAELAATCDLIIICVSRDEDVLEVINAMLPGLNGNEIIADTSTVSADTARTAAGRLKQKNAEFLDCPVSGGVEGAKNGTLAMMVGGEPAVLDRARGSLTAIAANIVHMGPAGSGQATKAVNQIMAAGINQAVTEALAFGESMGLEMGKVIDVVSSGAAGNWFLTHRGRTMVDGKFEPGFKLALHHKDLEICKHMAATMNTGQLPIVNMTLSHYQILMERGHGGEDISALYRLKRGQYNWPPAD